MQVLKYVTLTICHQQHQDDVRLLQPSGEQSHISKGPIEKDGKISK